MKSLKFVGPIIHFNTMSAGITVFCEKKMKKYAQNMNNLATVDDWHP